MDNCARFLAQNVNFQREITVALFAKNKRRGGGGAGLDISKQKGVKIALMAMKTTFDDFYMAE